MTALVDTDVLDLLVEAIGEEAARGVVALFFDECRDLTAAMAAPGASDAAIGRAAHSLKSSAGQLGALMLSKAALAVESAAASAAPDLPALVAALTRCAAETQAALVEKLR